MEVAASRRRLLGRGFSVTADGTPMWRAIPPSKKILCYEFVPEISGIRGSLTLVAGRQRDTATMADRIEMQTAVGACVYEVRVQNGCGNKRCSADLRGTPGVQMDRPGVGLVSALVDHS